ncbi:hypothetical protein GCK72_016825 [Caenorhabditis remanei]|uniref:7TM GPCR serpentine receptor class x (Srx) domain-containing protein n=1 Tax=Caenorhabditis remanei TaxID=31234 RepID=A0A6A5G5H2_CAERE|nr:hypothetical protein GCK72_016825 [Caenorhabditis remanei]KAF1750278.1 hypothetical protein GCK72_016825 [Caenorhabditis remanei]
MKDNSQHNGFLLSLFHNAAAQNQVLITINRFCAVFWPLIYKKLCSNKYTIIVILISFIIVLAQMITFFQILPCRIYYNEQILGYSYTELPLCEYYSYLDIGKQMGICVFNLVVDTITIWKVRRIRSAQGVTKIQKKEIDFLKQVIIFGVTCNGLVILAILTNRTLNHSFVILTGNQAVFNGIFGMVYVVYIIPMMVFDSKIMMDNSHHAGFLVLMCYDVAVQAHFLATVNRFCAVFMPVVYWNLFSRLTKLVVFTSFLISFTILTIFFQFLPCRCYYNEEIFSFTYNDYPICWDYVTVDVVKICGVCIFNVIVDTITIWKVRRIKSAQGTTKIQKKEIDFLKQSFGQALFLVISIPAFYIVPLFTTTPLANFIMRTLFWVSIHAVDGAITLYFNVEIRKSLAKQFKFNKGVSGPIQC